MTPDWQRHHSIAANLFACGAFLLLVTCCCAMVLGQWANVHIAYSQYQKNTEDDRSKAGKEAAERCKVGDVIPLTDCIEKQLTAYAQKYASNKDLQAQQDQAYWAAVAAIFSGFAVGSGVIGILLVWRTLDATRHTLEAARIQAAAASDQVSLMRHQQRAWLSITPVLGGNLIKTSDGWRIVVKCIVKNIGSVPATNVRVSVHITGMTQNAVAKLKDIVASDKIAPDTEVSRMYGITIFPDQPFEWVVTTPIEQDELDSAKQYFGEIGDIVSPAIVANVSYKSPAKIGRSNTGVVAHLHRYLPERPKIAVPIDLSKGDIPLGQLQLSIGFGSGFVD